MAGEVVVAAIATAGGAGGGGAKKFGEALLDRLSSPVTDLSSSLLLFVLLSELLTDTLDGYGMPSTI